MSVWKRSEGQLTYSLAGMHKLVPPPSRITNNATVNLLCLAASPWQRCLADAPHDTVLRSPAPSGCATPLAPPPISARGYCTSTRPFEADLRLIFYSMEFIVWRFNH